MQKSDSSAYLEKKSFFDRILTIYGRNIVLEALQNDEVDIHRLHLSESNRPAKVLSDILACAKKKNIDIKYHNKQALSRISRNSKQDQGVALDIIMPFSATLQEFLAKKNSYRLMVLDGIVNPQNLGMIIRSCAAGNIDAILLPDKGAAQISPLVIKASAGTLFKLPIFRVKSLPQTLTKLERDGSSIYALSADENSSYKDERYPDKTTYVLGNESDGVSRGVLELCSKSIYIPMHRGVESLNVAVAASLLAFME